MLLSNIGGSNIFAIWLGLSPGCVTVALADPLNIRNLSQHLLTLYREIGRWLPKRIRSSELLWMFIIKPVKPFYPFYLRSNNTNRTAGLCANSDR